jgi:predicted RNase H-like nuclease
VVMEVVETALEELAMAEVDWMAEGWETEPGKAVALASDDSAAVVAVTAAADLVSVVQAMAVEMVREKAEVMVAVEIVVVVMALPTGAREGAPCSSWERCTRCSS